MALLPGLGPALSPDQDCEIKLQHTELKTFKTLLRKTTLLTSGFSFEPGKLWNLSVIDNCISQNMPKWQVLNGSQWLSQSSWYLMIQCQRGATICQHWVIISSYLPQSLHHCHHCPGFCPSFGQREALAAALHILQHMAAYMAYIASFKRRVAVIALWMLLLLWVKWVDHRMIKWRWETQSIWASAWVSVGLIKSDTKFCSQGLLKLFNSRNSHTSLWFTWFPPHIHIIHHEIPTFSAVK